MLQVFAEPAIVPNCDFGWPVEWFCVCSKFALLGRRPGNCWTGFETLPIVFNSFSCLKYCGVDTRICTIMNSISILQSQGTSQCSIMWNGEMAVSCTNFAVGFVVEDVSRNELQGLDLLSTCWVFDCPSESGKKRKLSCDVLLFWQRS